MDRISKTVKFKPEVKDPTHSDVNERFVEGIKVASSHS
jgi:hypothetical protein